MRELKDHVGTRRHLLGLVTREVGARLDAPFASGGRIAQAE